MASSDRSSTPGVARHPLSEKWVPYKDPRTGEVVTITWPQVAAVLHAMRVVDEVRRTQARVHDSLDQPVRCQPLREDFPEKSRALGRLLVDGKALFEDMPPFEMGAAAYWVWDEENEQSDETMRADG